MIPIRYVIAFRETTPPPGEYEVRASMKVTEDEISIVMLNIIEPETSESKRSGDEEVEGRPQPVGILHSYWRDQDTYHNGEWYYTCRVLLDSGGGGVNLRIHEADERRAQSWVGRPVWDAGDFYVTGVQP